jgi:hypothetical protein
MISQQECQPGKHRMTYDQPLSIGGGWTGTGLICKKCGYQTFSSSTYVSIEKPCPGCGKQFEGMPDVDYEICDDCVQTNLDAWIEQVKACPHKRLRRGLCGDCGTGTHGRWQWRWHVLHWIEDLQLRLGISR